MKTILICPSERPAVAFLGRTTPLAAVPLLGQSLIEYWLSHLASSGAKEVLILAHDRPESIQSLVGDGARWGLTATLAPESRELTSAQALLKYSNETLGLPPQNSIHLLDYFPGRPDYPLFDSFEGWFRALQDWMPCALTPDRVGMKEQQPGVWVGSHSMIAPDARLLPPCWVGRHAFIGPGAILGPNSVIEEGALVEAGAEVLGSYIGPDTLVGKFGLVHDSIACGNTLIHWPTGSITEVADPFLLSALRQPRRRRTAAWFDRLTGFCLRNKEEAALLWKELVLDKES